MTQKASKTEFANKDILAAALAEDVAGALRTAFLVMEKPACLCQVARPQSCFFSAFRAC